MAQKIREQSAGKAKSGKLSSKEIAREVIKARKLVEDEAESTEGLEDEQPEPRTVDEANGQKSAKAKAAKAKAEKAPKLTPEQRRDKRQAEDAAVRAKGGVVRTASGKATARGLACLCGCGRPTVTDEAKFISGHDAQFRSRVLEGTQKLKSPESKLIRPFYEAGETIAGFTLEGGELADVHATANGESEE